MIITKCTELTLAKPPALLMVPDLTRWYWGASKVSSIFLDQDLLGFSLPKSHQPHYGGARLLFCYSWDLKTRNAFGEQDSNHNQFSGDNFDHLQGARSDAYQVIRERQATQKMVQNCPTRREAQKWLITSLFLLEVV